MSRKSEQLTISDSNRFLWLFGLGATLMLICKLVLSANQIFVTVPPLLIMALYFAQLARGHHATNRPERAGDNIYYLGFLFTLVSLALALYEFGVNADDKSGLIANFAIALSTTIFGVLGRVWLTQGDKEIDEYEKEAKIHVTEAIDDLRSDLERSRAILTEFASVTKQVLEETRDEQKKQLGKDREEFERHFTESLSKMNEVLTGAVNKGSEKLRTELEQLANNIVSQVGTFTTSVATLNSSSSELSSSLTAAVKSLRSMPNLEVLLKKKLEGVVSPLEEATERMVRILDQQTALAEQSTASVSKVGGTLTTLCESIEVIHAALTKVSVRAESIQAFTDVLDQMPQQLAQSIASIQNMGYVIGESTEKISGALNNFNTDVDKVRMAQMEAVSIDALKLRQLVADREMLISALSGTNQQIEENLVQLRSQLAAMSKALLGAAQYIRQKSDSIT